MEVGEIIKKARLAKGMTQEELGELVGVQKSAIAKYENGKVVNIKRRTLAKLAAVLDLRGSDLVIESDPKAAAELSAKVLLDSDIMELVELYSSLSPDKKKLVMDLTRSLAEK